MSTMALNSGSREGEGIDGSGSACTMEPCHSGDSVDFLAPERYLAAGRRESIEVRPLGIRCTTYTSLPDEWP